MPLKVHIPKILPQEKASVIKVIVGNKFYIGKTASITWFADALRKYYGKYAYKNGIREDNMFYPIIKQIYKDKLEDVHIDILFSSNDGYKVLKNEFNELKQHFGTNRCLNVNNYPIVPKTSYNEANKDKWLTLVQSLNYYKFLKKALQ